jgi:hypothetical protein
MEQFECFNEVFVSVIVGDECPFLIRYCRKTLRPKDVNSPCVECANNSTFCQSDCLTQIVTQMGMKARLRPGVGQCLPSSLNSSVRSPAADRPRGQDSRRPQISFAWLFQERIMGRGQQAANRHRAGEVRSGVCASQGGAHANSSVNNARRISQLSPSGSR